MKQSFQNADGKSILLKMVRAIQNNKGYMGEIDGLIGDGDHGMNMNKGFTAFEERYKDCNISFTEGLNNLGEILLNEIGGSMGPIYGTIFMSMAEEGEMLEQITLSDFAAMLERGLAELQEIIEAQVGDKTLIDTLSPSVDYVKRVAQEEASFAEAMTEMPVVAAQGRDSTRNLVAKFGRSSRLGERSRGVLDAGAVSCCLLLTAMAEGIRELL